jgi:hypothetical protein
LRPTGLIGYIENATGAIRHAGASGCDSHEASDLMPEPVPAPPLMFCLNCAYCLHGLSEQRCPECGRQFDPEKPATFSIRPIGRLAAYLLTPPGWVLHVYVILSSGCLLWLFSNPASSLWGWLFGLLMWSPLALFWGGRLFAYVLARILYCPRRKETVGSVSRWLAAPGLVLLAVLLIRANVPMLVRFRLSLPEIEQLRLQTMKLRAPSPSPTDPRKSQMFAVLPLTRKVGSFSTERAVAIDGDFQLWLRHDDLRWKYRFEYLQDDPSCPKDGEWHTVHERWADRRWIQGHWYLWRNVP